MRGGGRHYILAILSAAGVSVLVTTSMTFLYDDRPQGKIAEEDGGGSIVQNRMTKEKETVLRPMWGLEHEAKNDVVMSLAFGYRRIEFARFVSTLRRTGYGGDIVLATEPEESMKQGVAVYLKSQKVLAYGFKYECLKERRRRVLMTPRGCWLTNWYAKKDSRGPRPLALSRYEMYRSWLMKYDSTSWGMLFDFRDTYFQADPFARSMRMRTAENSPNLIFFAENRLVKTIGNCIFNSGWLGCWGTEISRDYANKSVLCSGSTLGSRDALFSYTERMIQEFDRMKCHLTRARIESDQGYHNYLYHSGLFAQLHGVRLHYYEQGHGGIVNTIGAMNGHRIPHHLRGPLDTFWNIQDKHGYIYDYDGTLSAAIHQWDRFGNELLPFVDHMVREYEAPRGINAD